jgi:transposase, IS30 family
MSLGYRHFGFQERIIIQSQLTLGLSPAAIAAGLDRARSSVWREIRRNGWLRRPPHRRIAGGYRALLADRRARHLAARPQVPRRLAAGNRLWEIVLGHLRRHLSPEQISRTLASMKDPVRLSHQAIYDALYAMPRGELRTRVLDLLRRRHKARRTGTGAKTGRSRSIPDMTSIDQRPDEVHQRLVPGHWEGDLIIGKGNRSQVGTLVERTTLFLALVKLENGRADTTARGFATILQRFEGQLRRSMTYDQGTEMAHHRWLTAQTGVQVYFAHPHAPWERGICENINGLVRDYLPRGLDLSVFSQQQLDAIAWEMNTRPRKTLGWKCPAELLLPEADFNFSHYWSGNMAEVAREH